MKHDDARLLLPEQDISIEVLIEKYAKGEERTPTEVRRRVARALAEVEAPDAREPWAARFLDAMEAGFIPGGRINSAAGTGIAATLINCFVQPVGDSVWGYHDDGTPGIYAALQEAAETMRRGGGVGYDFSAIRPRGAKVRGTHSRASGPVSYMRVFDKSCETLESAGARRGAQMAVLRCDHPDVLEFIHAKRDGTMANFNMSVAVTDAFMQAVEADAEFALAHAAEPFDAAAHGRDAAGRWVYRVVRARQMWDQVMRSTYSHAEPGVIFVDQVNRDNNLGYCESIQATNPCVTADTWVMAADGPRQVAELVGRPFVAVVDGERHPSGPQGFFRTGTRPVLRLRTRQGHSVRLTGDHLVRKVAARTRHTVRHEWVPAGSLKAGDEIALHDHRALPGWGGAGTEPDGYLLGLLLGDGTIKSEGAVLSVWCAERTGLAANGDAFGALSAGTAGIMRAVQAAIDTHGHRQDLRGWHGPVRANGGEYRLKSAALTRLALSFGMTQGRKAITSAVEKASCDFYRGFLRGLFDADGSVQGSQAKGVSVRLAQSSIETLEAVQRMLLRLGIGSTLYGERRPAGPRVLPDGRGGRRAYDCAADHELVIAGDHLARFGERVGFADADKAEALAQALGAYRRAPNRERFVAVVESIEDDGIEDVYDANVAGVHAFDANGLYVHNCGEQPLPAYGCCCLGSVNLTRFVRDPFGQAPGFDFERLREVVAVSVRMLDNVLDATRWPLERQASEARDKRRVGLGFTGLGNALAMLNLRYDGEAGRAMAARVAEAMRDAAYAASVELARERGPFPLLDAEQYLAEPRFAARLPGALQAAIRAHGIRNSHLLSIAPTGTISLAFAGNASGGIEPPFSWGYVRKKRMPDGTKKEYAVEDYAWRLYRHVKGLAPEVELVSHDAQAAQALAAQGIDPLAPYPVADAAGSKRLRAMLPPAFVTALEMSALDHARMSAAVQPFVDSAISKTVNVAEDYPYEDFKELYLQAWRSGLKGITTYRPNSVIGSVLEVRHDAPAAGAPAMPTAVSEHDESAAPAVARAAAAAMPQDLTDDPDRRLRLDAVPQPALASLRWPGRPELPAGNMAWSFMVEPAGRPDSFAIFIGQEGDPPVPFEVWVNGGDAPRGLGAIAKSLSMDMRCEDRAWLKGKLDALAKTRDERPLQVAFPPDGERRWKPGVVAAFAEIVRHRCDRLGVFESLEGAPTPMLDAVMFRKEPKSGALGTLSWTVDVRNPATGDDFVLGVKELQLPDGTRRPYSIWLSGDYPRVLDGLCKLLSIDMRVIDASWIGLKLRKLLNFGEANGAFWAQVPGEARSQQWPSTVAYMAALILHRLRALGLVDEQGRALAGGGILAAPAASPASRAPGRAARLPDQAPLRGELCGECGSYAVARVAGCQHCTACGWTGQCG